MRALHFYVAHPHVCCGKPLSDLRTFWHYPKNDLPTSPVMVPSRFMPASKHVPDPPEMTFRAVALGLFLALVFGAANAYLGMKAGQPIAAFSVTDFEHATGST